MNVALGKFTSDIGMMICPNLGPALVHTVLEAIMHKGDQTQIGALILWWALVVDVLQHIGDMVHNRPFHVAEARFAPHNAFLPFGVCRYALLKVGLQCKG